MANPFDDFRTTTSSNHLKSYTNSNNIEDEADYYEREIEKYMQDSLDSTQRSRAHLENSEKLAVDTATNLLAQKEKLENTERNLDEINRTTQSTQRNLNSLKSVFGGFFKNKFSKKPSESVPELPQSKSASALSSEVSRLESSEILQRNSATGGTLNESSRAAIKGTRWETMDKEIDDNLDAMSANLARLKGMGSALGKEVEDQNQMLDRIHMKAERNDAVVRSQDKQMQKILGSDTNASSSEQSTMSSMTPSVSASTKLSMMSKFF